MLANEAVVRVSAFGLTLTLLWVMEYFLPRREQPKRQWFRRVNNLLLVVVNSVVLRILLPVTAVVTAEWAIASHWGLLNQLSLPGWVSGVIAFLILDLAIYGQHVAMHYFSWLWPLHRVHHSDRVFDATTGIRFHTLEIVLSMLWKVAVVLILGPPVVAVIVFEIMLNAISMFNHSNIAIPLRLDALFRSVVVTPDMHRVHHSIFREEHDCNYGFNFSWWDFLFRTYLPQPKEGHREMKIGVPGLSESDLSRLDRLLYQPLRHPRNDSESSSD
ncbi:sterol desaturase family protein [Rubinisphaera margarita]|uniref:sterol desaturase family protein n=1 Tax=Rubinisphaera margarita TaxID=2909586 RepID=UPI001EE8F78A|nr:sterol desaturase family protein [Rubinisphaera margarita]MCG6158361.1 sterol desaturase family protein [Rubinisphaera margarita]